MRSSASSYKNGDNIEIYERNIPSVHLESYISLIPESTKYNFPDLKGTKRVEALESHQFRKRSDYEQKFIFNPGSSAPWKGYCSHIDDESTLRNQTNALQKCSQNMYVPSSNSDLYTYQFSPSIRTEPKHHLLFKEQTFMLSNVTPHHTVGQQLFFNDTRGQLKSI